MNGYSGRMQPVAGFIATAIAAAVLTVGLDYRPATAARAHPKAKESATAAQTPAKATGGMDTQSGHTFIIEVETGAVLLDKGADERIPPASMSSGVGAKTVVASSVIISPTRKPCC